MGRAVYEWVVSAERVLRPQVALARQREIRASLRGIASGNEALEALQARGLLPEHNPLEKITIIGNSQGSPVYAAAVALNIDAIVRAKLLAIEAQERCYRLVRKAERRPMVFHGLMGTRSALLDLQFASYGYTLRFVPIYGASLRNLLAEELGRPSYMDLTVLPGRPRTQAEFIARMLMDDGARYGRIFGHRPELNPFEPLLEILKLGLVATFSSPMLMSAPGGGTSPHYCTLLIPRDAPRSAR